MAEHHHGQRVADQDAVDARLVRRVGGGEVVRGDERQRLAAAVLVAEGEDRVLRPLAAGGSGVRALIATPSGGRAPGARPAARVAAPAASRSAWIQATGERTRAASPVLAARWGRRHDSERSMRAPRVKGTSG